MKGISSVLVAIFLVVLVMGLLLAAYYVEGPMLAEQRYSTASPLKLVAGNDYLNITNTGYAPIIISSVVVEHQNSLAFYNYSATIMPGQKVSLYLFFAPGDKVGVETSGGVVWST
ncbi:MAG: hypothetical protein QXV17_05325 [Candidatus Micrarchaeaceae archaeon]